MARPIRLFDLILFCLGTASALPSGGFLRDTQRNIAGVASNIVAANILQNNGNNDGNLVFSPLGFSAILAILGEGSRGETLREISNVLSLPNNVEQIRETYKEVLARMQGDNPHSAPQFKNWFYIYRNNTVEEDYKKIISDNYLVDVKEINREYYDWNDPETSENIESVTEEEDHLSVNSKDIEGFEDLKKSKPFENGPQLDFEDIPEKECSKFDKEVDDKQYVEVPVIKEEIERQNEGSDSENTIFDEQKETFLSEDNNGNIKSETNEEPEKFKIPIKKIDEFEIMQAVESHPMIKRFNFGRSLQLSGDIASALSGNSIVGKKSLSSDDKTTTEATESKMLLFNGLYFRGSWASPFQQLRNEEDGDMFYTSETEKQKVTMMRARGSFKVGKISYLDCEAIELPYTNERYSLLVLMPSKNDGLQKLIASFTADTITRVTREIGAEPINLYLPKFNLEETIRVEKPLAKAGLASLFTSKADLSGITKEQKLHVDELVQHVSLRIDEGASSENALTATNTVQSKTDSEDVFAVNRPFLFFVRDTIDDIVIVAGKVQYPIAKAD